MEDTSDGAFGLAGGISLCGPVGKEKETSWEGNARIRAFCKARVFEWKSEPD